MLFSYEARRFLVLSAAFLCSFGFDVDLKQSHIHSKCCDPKEINNQKNQQLRKPFCGQWRLVFYKSAGLVSLSQRRMVWGSKKCLKQLSRLISTRGSFMAGTSCQQSDTVIVLLPRSVALWSTMGIYWLYCVSRLDPGTIWSNDVSIQARSLGSSAWATQVACKSAPYSKNTSTLLDCTCNGVTVVWNQLWSRLDQWNSNLTWWPTVSISPDTRFAYDLLKHQVNSTSNTRNRPMHISNHFHTSWSPFACKWCP